MSGNRDDEDEKPNSMPRLTMNEDCNLFEASQVSLGQDRSNQALQVAPKRKPKSYLWKFVILFAVVNSLIIYGCFQIDDAMGIMVLIFMIGPCVNAILGIASFIWSMILKWKYSEFPLESHLLISFILPFCAVFSDWYIVSTLCVPSRGGS